MEDRKEIVRNLYRAIDAHQFDDAVALLTPSFRATMPGLPEPSPVEAYRAAGESLMGAMPDGSHEITRFLIDGNTVAIEATFEGTHSASLGFGGQEIPASHNRVRLGFAALIAFEGDRIAAIDIYFDTLALMVQMGAVSV